MGPRCLLGCEVSFPARRSSQFASTRRSGQRRPSSATGQRARRQLTPGHRRDSVRPGLTGASACTAATPPSSCSASCRRQRCDPAFGHGHGTADNRFRLSARLRPTIASATWEASGSGCATPLPDERNRPWACVGDRVRRRLLSPSGQHAAWELFATARSSAGRCPPIAAAYKGAHRPRPGSAAGAGCW
jgi:hypothetical protein